MKRTVRTRKPDRGTSTTQKAGGGVSRFFARTPSFTSARNLVAEPISTKWSVKNILPADSIVGCVGPTETLKTAVICDLCAAVAGGHEWHGHTVTRGSAFIVAGEGRSGIARRLKAIAVDRGVKVPKPLYVSDSGTSLVNRNATFRLIARIRRTARKAGVRPALIVFDTVARNFAPGDENSAADMSVFIDNVDRVRRRFHCTVVLVHHTGHADKKRARGSSAFKAAVDREILFERHGDQVTIKCTKSKDSRPFDDLSFDMHEVELPDVDEDGVHETSIVLKSADLVIKRGTPPRKQIAVLRVLKKLLQSQGRPDPENSETRVVSVESWLKAVKKEGIVGDENAFGKLKAKLRKRDAVAIARGMVRLK